MDKYIQIRIQVRKYKNSKRNRYDRTMWKVHIGLRLGDDPDLIRSVDDKAAAYRMMDTINHMVDTIMQSKQFSTEAE